MSTHSAEASKPFGNITSQEPLVSEGSWSDRLSTAIEGTCKSEEEWLTASTEECGKKPTNYVLGAQCGDQDKYVEVTFTCDKPRTDVYTDILTVKKNYHRKLELTIFGRLAHIVEKESPYTETYNRSIENALTAATLPQIMRLSLGYHYAVPLHLKSYMSRELVFAQAKEYVISLGEWRYYELFRMATDLLMYGNNMDTRIQQIAECDTTNIFKHIEVVSHGKRFDEQIALFPELKEPLTAYYVEYMKDHTFGIAREHLGFLNECGADARLASMYQEIFRPGFMDKKYLDSFSSHVDTPAIFVKKFI
uniref:TENA_THI-4 domain-containing protein n=1 Tax=Steinernema glaseri TaxID=37863 RepID=A0A1I7Y5K2_9BILA